MTCFRECTRVKIGVFYGKTRFDKFPRMTAKSDINLEQSSHVETVALMSRVEQ